MYSLKNILIWIKAGESDNKILEKIKILKRNLTSSRKYTNITNMKIDNTQILYLRMLLLLRMLPTVVCWCITLSNNSREFILDPCYTTFNFIDGVLNLTVHLERMTKLPDCDYDLTKKICLMTIAMLVFFRTEAEIVGMTLHVYNR